MGIEDRRRGSGPRPSACPQHAPSSPRRPTSAGLDDDGTHDLILATSEAVANAVQHGEAWPNDCILLVTEPSASGLRVEVSDCGRFDSTLEPAPLDATCGRGIAIIAAVVDRLEVRNGNGQTVICFERHVSRPRRHLTVQPDLTPIRPV